MSTIKSLIVAVVAVVGSAFVVGCGAAPDPTGDSEQALLPKGGNPGACDPQTTCCVEGYGSAPGQCYTDLRALGCAGQGPAVAVSNNGTAFYNMGCPSNVTTAPSSCIPYGAQLIYKPHCYQSYGYSSLAVDPNCGGTCHVVSGS